MSQHKNSKLNRQRGMLLGRIALGRKCLRDITKRTSVKLPPLTIEEVALLDSADSSLLQLDRLLREIISKHPSGGA